MVRFSGKDADEAMKKIEDYRNELEKFINLRGGRLSDCEIVKKSLEVEKIIYNIHKNKLG